MPIPVAFRFAVRAVVLPAPSAATLEISPPLALLALKSTLNPAALLSVAELVEETVPA